MDGVNENGEYLVDTCAERGLFLANYFFQHKMIHRYTWRRDRRMSIDKRMTQSSIKKK